VQKDLAADGRICLGEAGILALHRNPDVEKPDDGSSDDPGLFPRISERIFW
jgi:hypothetical protein